MSFELIGVFIAEVVRDKIDLKLLQSQLEENPEIRRGRPYLLRLMEQIDSQPRIEHLAEGKKILLN